MQVWHVVDENCNMLCGSSSIQFSVCMESVISHCPLNERLTYAGLNKALQFLCSERTKKGIHVTDLCIHSSHSLHSFISVMQHHYECVASNVDINLQSGRLWFWATVVSCFIQAELHWFQVLLGSLHPRSIRTSRWSPSSSSYPKGKLLSSAWRLIQILSNILF